jgi:4-amino-4-deoxy-L-arabinose transferase-like glycosyltransferase
VPPSRSRSVVDNPGLWVLLVYACGIALRALYTYQAQSPLDFIYSDMGLYVGLARRMVEGIPLIAPDVTHPLGYPALLALLLSGGHSLSRVIHLQFVVSCLVPAAVGLLGAAAYGRRTGLLATVFASLYYPFIEYGALFLAEIHFILWMALAFAGLFGARRARRRRTAVAMLLGAGVALSIAASLKSVALPAAFIFLVVDGLALVARPAGAPAEPLPRRLRPWLVRAALVAVAAAPLLGALARVCTTANDGRFCVTGNKMGSDFLLGHYGRIADIEWRSEGHDLFRFGSPGALLRHYEEHVKVPFSMTDGAANKAEAWRWIGRHPGEAIVLSLDHVYDTFFGPTMWPTLNSNQWPFGHLTQYVFFVFLLLPTVLACARVLRLGARAAIDTQTARMMAPILALAITVAIATGEVRYRIPFDIFFIAIACAYLTGDLARTDLRRAASPSGTGAAPARS